MAEKRPGTTALRAMPETDLRGQLDSLRQELWQQRIKAKEGSQQQVHQIGTVRRQIARVLTMLREQRHA